MTAEEGLESLRVPRGRATKKLAAFDAQQATEKGYPVRVDSLAEVARSFLGHLESGGRQTPEEFLGSRAEDPEALDVLTVLAGLREQPADSDRLGPYVLLRELGRGAQAVVYLARDTRLDREVALKVLSPHAAFGADLQGVVRDLKLAGGASLLETVGALRRFRREVEATARLEHPGICPVYEAGMADGNSFIAMRHVEGATLAARLAQAPGPPQTRADVEAVCTLVGDTARALHAAHEAGLVHRDVKPGNIMVADDGTPTVLDFGLAREIDATDLTRTGTAVGTPVYMSPEQVAATHPVDRRTDVYALGVVLFECLTGARPFDAPTVDGLYRQILESDAPSPRRMNPAVPPELGIVVETALQKEPNRRYRTALDLAEDLRRVRERLPIRAKPTGRLLRLRRWAERNPGVAASLAAIFLLLVTGVVVMTGAWKTTRDERDAKTAALRKSRAIALASASAAERDSNAMGALLLAREAARFELSPMVVSALHHALAMPLETAVLEGHEDSVVSVAFSSDGTRLLTGSHDKTARIWDVEGRQLAVLAGHEEEVTGVAFSPEGDRILTCSWDGTVRLWDAEGNPVATLREHEGRVLCCAYSPDGRFFATGGADRTARLWHADGTPYEVALRHDGPVAGVEFSADGHLLTAAWDRTARLWRLDGAEVRRFQHRWMVRGATFSPDGERVLTVGGSIRLFERDGTEVYELLHHGGIHARFAPDGKRFLVGGEWNRTALCSSDGWTTTPLRGHHAAVYSVAFHRDCRRVATASDDASVKVWELDGGEGTAFRGHEMHVHGVDFTRDQERVVTASADGTARIWRVDGTQETVLQGHRGMVSSAVFGPEGEHVLTASRDRTARLWSRAGEEMLVLQHDKSAFGAEFSPDGTRIVTASADATARIWNRAGEIVRVLDHPQWVTWATFAPDGEHVVTTCWDDKVRLWRADGEMVRVMEHAVTPRQCAVSPDGRLIASVANSGLRVWRWDGTLVVKDRLHSTSTYSVAFAGDGQRLVTGSSDGTARIWDLDGTELAVLPCGSGVLATRFSPDGRHVLTGAAGGAVRLWCADPEDLLRVVDGKLARGFTKEERARFADLLD